MPTRRKSPKRITVLVDSREQHPLVFPGNFEWWDGTRTQRLRVETERRKLDYADYLIEGHEGICGVERKGSVRELAQNLSNKDISRFRAALQRLVDSVEYPCLLLDMPVAASFRKDPYVDCPMRTISRIFKLAQESSMDVLWIPTAQSVQGAARTGELVLHWMWNAISIRKEIAA